MSDFRMPALGADMEAGTLVEWLVKPGDRVKRGDVVAVVETQKGAIEVEIFDEGIISQLAPLGSKAPVGGVLAHVAGAAPARATLPTAVPPPASPARPAPPSPAAVPPIAPMRPPSVPSAGGKITPAARRRAAELGIDPGTLQGTGIDGSITLADVEVVAMVPRPRMAPPAAGPARRAGFDPAEMRRAIAAAMVRAKRDIPHYYLSHRLDLGAALGWLESFNAAQPVSQRLLPVVLLLKAAALALREMPLLNGTYTEGEFHAGDGIHPGWAISLRGGGLVAPAIGDADKRPLPELMAAMRDLVQRARSGGLRASELSMPTVTVTSLGDRGVESVTAIIYPPQVAIVGFGTVLMRPWVVNGRVEPRPVVTVSLAADHRVTDGHIGARLLSTIERLLQEPASL
jgi:pyruvate dehydrogenase E2 component (dihydrolipoamide acetyltransferase)